MAKFIQHSHRCTRSFSRIFIVAALITTLGICLGAQAPAPAAPPAPQAQTAPPPLPDSQAVLAFLTQTIKWYRDQNLAEALPDTDLHFSFSDDERVLTDQVLALSFDFARANAHLLEAQGQAPDADIASSGSTSERYQQLAKKTAARIQQKEGEVAELKQRLAAASDTQRRGLQAAVGRAQSDLELSKTAGEAIKSLAQFAASGGTAASGRHDLLAKIDDLERQFPQVRLFSASNTASGAAAAPATAPAPATSATAVPHHAEPSGILGLTGELSDLSRATGMIDQAARDTDQLAQASSQLGTPLRARLRDAFRRGDALGDQPLSDDVALLQQEKNEIDQLTAQFKRISTASIPLSKQRILFDAYKGRLANWRGSLDAHRDAEFRRLIMRLIGLALTLLVALLLSETWRRATFRYVHDAHRRHQFLMLRRVVTLVVIAVIITLSLATDISSLTTFAGLLTAGIAIAMQNVILSVVGYFVLIGRYGIRVGDRLQISRVTGKVAEIGLVRLYLIELSGSGSDVFPTGRIVEFPNSVVFDANAGVFKQLPGTQFVWHEVTTVLARDSNYRAIEQNMLQAANAVFAGYREAIEQQHRTMERKLRLAGNPPCPQSRFRLNPAGIDVTIRYPVEVDRAAEIDDRMSRALLEAIEQGKAAGASASS